MELPDPETLLANVIRFLIDQQQQEAATHLLACTIRLDTYIDWNQTYLSVYLTGPNHTYTLLSDESYETQPIRSGIKKAFAVFLPGDLLMGDIVPKIELSPVDPEWRTEMSDLLKGRQIDNQGTEFDQGIPVKLWMNLRFRSQSEIRIAEALDRAAVLFLPNSRTRLGSSTDRKNREADFLVCVDGKWGILEVDGEPFHPPSRTVHDHERDRLFKMHGIRVAEHFDAEKCRREPDLVVRTFIELLRKA